MMLFLSPHISPAPSLPLLEINTKKTNTDVNTNINAIKFCNKKQIQKEQKYSSDAVSLSLSPHISPGLALRLLEINTKNTNTDKITNTYTDMNTDIYTPPTVKQLS